MKVYILVIIFAAIYHNVNCLRSDYKLAWIGRDIKNSFTSLYNYLATGISNIKTKVMNYFNKGGGQSKTVRLEEPREDEGAKEAFSEFTKNKWANLEMGKNAYVSLKSESVVQLATPQLALWHGRNMESHVVETQDGYLLTLHRVANYPFVHNRTVILHHGLLGSSTDWILSGPQLSLPYILADAGYDVWIANARGNYYSRGHIAMTVDFSEYWKFSWQEMGQYDLPAVIDYIRLVKNTNESINFVAHSMGATALLVLLSTTPKYNSYLRMGILIAPLVFMKNVAGPFKVLTTVSEDIIKMMGEGEFLPTRKVPSWLANKYCKGPKVFCSNPLLFLSGIPEDKKWNSSFIARLLYHVPAGGSINTILHYIQMAKSGKFHKYNDETDEFPLKDVTLPIVMFSSSDDWLATVPNVLKLYFLMQNPIDHHIIRYRNVTHTDFVWGTEATRLVFNKILEYLEDGLSFMVKTNEVD